MTIINSSQPETVVQADQVPGPGQGNWTYADYAALPEDGQRYEIIEGVLYMAPSAGEPHQTATTRFIIYLGMQIELAGLGRVYAPPFDVELGPNRIVQPDVTVVLNNNLGIITPNRIVGAPDLVIEVKSPATARYDRNQKLNTYAQSGVKEYWIADPNDNSVEVLSLQNGQYQSLGVFRGQQLLTSQVVPNLPYQVDLFFL